MRRGIIPVVPLIERIPIRGRRTGFILRRWGEPHWFMRRPIRWGLESWLLRFLLPDLRLLRGAPLRVSLQQRLRVLGNRTYLLVDRHCYESRFDSPTTLFLYLLFYGDNCMFFCLGWVNGKGLLRWCLSNPTHNPLLWVFLLMIFCPKRLILYCEIDICRNLYKVWKWNMKRDG